MKRFLVLLPGLAPFLLWADETAPGIPEPFHIRAGIAYFLGLAPRRVTTLPFTTELQRHAKNL